MHEDAARSSRRPLREKIAAQGMRNSNVLAIAPTATISNIMGSSPCIEPLYKNLFVKANLSGEFVTLNPHLVRDLKKRGLWSRDLADRLKYFDGDLTELDVPEDVKERYRTAFQLEWRALIDAAARRQKWIDQSQSLNLFLVEPDLKALSHMYRHAWHSGLKTTYYLRTLGASTIEKATVKARARPSAPGSVGSRQRGGLRGRRGWTRRGVRGMPVARGTHDALLGGIQRRGGSDVLLFSRGTTDTASTRIQGRCPPQRAR